MSEDKEVALMAFDDHARELEKVFRDFVLHMISFYQLSLCSIK